MLILKVGGWQLGLAQSNGPIRIKQSGGKVLNLRVWLAKITNFESILLKIKPLAEYFKYLAQFGEF